MRFLLLLSAFLILPLRLLAEDGHAAWLRYAPLPAAEAAAYASLPTSIHVAGTSPVQANAANELARGLTSMLSRPFEVDSATTGPAITLRLAATANPRMEAESYTLRHTATGFEIAAADERGLLYGAFSLLEVVAAHRPLPTSPWHSAPAAPIRWVNQWDNLDGSIERGYAGRSIFFDNGHVRPDLARVAAYGRLLASIGINGLTINNVNSDLRTLQPDRIAEFARVADALRPWGVRMSLSVDLSSPEVVGHLRTFDPLDPQVIAWWQTTIDGIYKLIPDFAGVVVKADSEGRAGPSQYHRTPAEAANVLARPLAAHHGLVLYRGFVYNHHLDWNDLKADRARAGYDNFRALDGSFEPNVVLQIKHGPIDFQVREPVSPLFAAMRHTPEAIELQTSQEYTGQQRHMVFLVPMWKWVLNTDMRAGDRPTPVKSIVEGHAFHQPTGGFVSVVNVGLDANWLHHPMALANLYGYGRLAWNPDASAESIVDTWTRLTFGNQPDVVRTIDTLQLESWHAYEQYTGPLGIGTLTDIIGYHFGPNAGSAEHNGWGQWFRGDHDGVGMDRTTATGTGYIGQYPPQLAAQYESLATCPDDLLLFMHHVPYGYRLHSGDTVIQHLYDSHYAGATTAASYAPRWRTLEGKIDAERFNEVLGLFTFQAGHAAVWRDAIDQYFFALSGIPDDRGRVGHNTYRIEAEAMRAQGYRTVDVKPSETASGGRAVTCDEAPRCTLTTTIERTGRFQIATQYFDLRNGIASYQMLLNGKAVASWKANDTLPPAADDPHFDGQTSTRFATPPLDLHTGDILSLQATPEAGDPAGVDYIELIPTAK